MSDFTITHKGGIAEYRLMRPDSRNSLTFEMYQAIEDLCEHPDEAGVIVLTAEGHKAFASGTDISNFKDFQSAQDAINYEALIGRVIDAVQRSSVPVIASLHGIVAGGGAAIAAAADVRLATPDTRFGMPIARTLGNCLSVANLNRLVHLLGESRPGARRWHARRRGEAVLRLRRGGRPRGGQRVGPRFLRLGQVVRRDACTTGCRLG